MKTTFKKLLCGVICAMMLASLAVPGFAVGESRVLAVAHRGYSGAAPENSLAAMRLAGENGYYGCEFDIQPTKDGVWVVMHDDTVDRTTNGSGKISDLTYAELSAFTIDNGNGLEQFPDEKIPTLEEALDVSKEYSIRPVIEVKGGKSEDMPALAELLNSREEKDDFIVISFTWEFLEPLRRLMPETEMWMLAQQVLPSHINFCKENKIDGISFNYKKNVTASIAMIRAAGLKAISWTVDNAFVARRLAARGVIAITTNKLLPEETEKPGAGIADFLNSLGEVIERFFESLFEKC